MRKNAADKIEKRDIDALVANPDNARTHSDEQIAQIAKSIEKWGWTMPVLIDESDGIIAGHGRVEAAKRLGLKSAPVIVAKGWSETEKRMYMLADNKLALNAGWDEQLLRIELEDLKGVDDIGLIGFNEFELEGILGLAPTRQKPTSGEVDADSFEMQHRCPKCGFEFNDG